jgi:DNA-binding NarL/FixJ family response regulator
VLLVDTDQLIAEALHRALRGAGVDVHHVMTRDPVILLAIANQFSQAVVLFNLVSPTVSPVVSQPYWVPTPAGVVGPLRNQGKPVVLLVGELAEAEAAACLAAGASGVVPVAASFDELLAALAAVSFGERIMSDQERREWTSAHVRGAPWRRQAAQRLERLTGRERQVLQLLASGHRAALIAQELVVSVATIRTQIRAILMKLEVNSQLQAVALLNRQYVDAGEAVRPTGAVRCVGSLAGAVQGAAGGARARVGR